MTAGVGAARSHSQGPGRRERGVPASDCFLFLPFKSSVPDPNPWDGSTHNKVGLFSGIKPLWNRTHDVSPG